MGINYREILQAYPEVAHLQDGEEIKRNHVGCEAGTDTKQRLFIKRVDGNLLFYCHHCAKGGGKGSRRNHIRGKATANNVLPDVYLPQDIMYRNDMVNVHANVWLNKAGITQEERDRYLIGWSGYDGRVILPVFSNAGDKLLAYQRRRILPGDERPKYLTTRRADTPHPIWFGRTHHHTHRVVIVEDILSGVKVNRVENSCALLTTSMPEWLLWHLVGEYDHAVIWLDNDNQHVNAAARKIAKRLDQFMDSTEIVREYSDPKHYSTDKIRRVLDSYVTHGV